MCQRRLLQFHTSKGAESGAGSGVGVGHEEVVEGSRTRPEKYEQESDARANEKERIESCQGEGRTCISSFQSGDHILQDQDGTRWLVCRFPFRQCPRGVEIKELKNEEDQTPHRSQQEKKHLVRQRALNRP